MKRLLIGLSLVLVVMGANAEEDGNPTPDELSKLPAFCARRLSGAMSQEEMKNYPNIHHYCLGLNFANRATRKRTAQSRGYNLQNARDNINYTLRTLPPKHWLRPQVCLDLARVLVQLKEEGEAMRCLTQAIEQNPAFEPAYFPLIEGFKRSGSASSALDIARLGLQHLPNSQYLKKAYLELGGKAPFPEPVQPPPDAKQPSNASSPDVVEGALVQETIRDGVGDNAAGTSSPDSKERPANAREVTGCRFCPPDEIQKKWRDSFGGAPKE